VNEGEENNIKGNG